MLAVAVIVVAALAVVGLVLLVGDEEEADRPTSSLAGGAAGSVPGSIEGAGPTSPATTAPAAQGLPELPELPTPTPTLPPVGLVTTAAPTVVLPPGQPLEVSGGDAALDALAAGCFAGDMEACDELYFDAPAGSPYQEYGDTCARRQPANSGRLCTDAFPSASTTTG